MKTEGLTKTYKLFGNVADQALDVLGLGGLLFWRRVEPRTFSALKGIDLELRHGERIGIVGRNGAGKSTLLKLLTGALEPTSGSLEVRGDVQALLHVGIGFHPEFTGIENIRASLLYSGLSTAECKDAEADIIHFCELGDFLYQPFKTYSLGMKARIQFACATAIKPDILIVDEILGAGDAYFSTKSSDRMQTLTGTGCTLLIVSHSMQQIIQFCDRVIWLDSGRIVQDGPARVVVTAYERFMFELSHGATEERLSALRDWRNERLSANAGAEQGRAALRATPEASPAEEVEVDTATQPIPDWYRVRLGALMGGEVPTGDYGKIAEDSRWVSDGRLRIVGIAMRGADGRRQISFQRGSATSFDILVEAQESGAFDCWFVILIYGNDGKPLVRHVSEKQVFHLHKGARRLATLRYEKLLIGQGEYHASIAIYRSWNPDDRSSARWYELLNRSIEFRIEETGQYDPSLFHHPSSWAFAE